MLGICSVCGRPATHTCSMCGRPVCSAHYDAEKRMCPSCAAKVRRRPR